MKPRVNKTALLATGLLLLPLAFGPLINSPERTGDHLNDGKARALAAAADDAHAALDASKEARIELALEEAELFADQQVPAPAPCVAGFAGPYPCENVDLAAVVPLAELGGAAGNDSWGWTDPETGAEIALVGTGTGIAFVDVTAPTTPIVLGRVETEGYSYRVLWRDVKVDQDHAFIVSEVGGHGMQVFDLTRLRDVVVPGPQNIFEPDVVYSEFGGAHNIAVNTDTHYAYAVGTDTCEGGLHMVDISTPTAPTFAGCFDEDFYTHDVQCVLYDGPDEDHNGTPADEHGSDNWNDVADGKAAVVGQSEICFAANEDSVTIVDVTDKSAPEMIGKIGYETAGYTHQGWLTPDKHWFVFNDELDEDRGNVDNTTTYMVDVSELDLGLGDFTVNTHPRARAGQEHIGVFTGDDDEPLVKTFTHESRSIDHNLYITDDGLIWEANYNQGLRILREGEDGFEAGDLDEIGYFDVDPGVDVKAYGDTWNVYPFFESGTVILSNLGQGLVVLQPNYDELRGE